MLHPPNDPPPRPLRARRLALVEVSLATAAVGLVIAGSEALARIWPTAAANASAVVALAFIGVPLVAARLGRLRGDVHGVQGGRIGRGVLLGLAATVVIAGPFALGFDVLEVRYRGLRRGAGPGWFDHPTAFSGTPARSLGRVVICSDGVGLRLYNGLSEPVRMVPQCSGPTCSERLVRPAAKLWIGERASSSFVLLHADGSHSRLEVASIVTGGGARALDAQPIRAPRGLSWLLWALLIQLLVVAFPEEVFFRGYVQGRLVAVMPPRRRLLGVPFGTAHVLAAALFAVIHLVAIPAGSRLLVFFPGLLFAWLRERGANVVAPTVHHALSNLMLRIAGRFYG